MKIHFNCQTIIALCYIFSSASAKIPVSFFLVSPINCMTAHYRTTKEAERDFLRMNADPSEDDDDDKV